MAERTAIEMELAEEVLRSYGKLRVVARGSSMIPTIFPGDILLVERNPVERLQPGDVVLASRGGRFFAHRVVRLTALGGPPRVITRGDALRETDPAFSHDEILGRVTAVSRGRRHIDMSGEGGLSGKRILQWAIQSSDRITAAILWWHARLGQAVPAAPVTSVRVPARLAEFS
ncbi:MAG TPA: S24/S26 family peptidase [Candidatus Acidoferrales bacterium]|jgi:signal peptidase I|nr:S24/S26 family peptidase [Candidatus Acidoferrales bacterium]